MNHTFLWHDYETFGIHPAKDRPAQFAAIRTDAALNEIGAPIMHYCQQTPDYLPSAGACLITGITPQQCNEQGLPEYQFAEHIQAAFSEPGTIGTGYNTLRFDDEFTRHLFWRNLIDPYAREWQNQCSRWDLLDVVRTTFALRPEGITWPEHEDGKPSFRLEHLTAANQIAHQGAHDALVDVRATIALARLIQKTAPRLFDFCLALRHKAKVLEEIGGVGAQGRPLLHISGMFDASKGCLAIVFPLAQHPNNKNEIIAWNLAEDPRILASLDADQIRSLLFVRQSELPEGQTRLPIKTIHINKSPIIIQNLKTLRPASAEKRGIHLETALKHAADAQALADLTPLWAQVYNRPAFEANDAEYDLYGGFVNTSDRRALTHWLTQDFNTRIQTIPLLEDARLNTLLARYRARYAPEQLNELELEEWQNHCQARLIQGEHGARTAQALFDEIDTLNETATEAQVEVLSALYDYAESIIP